MEKLRRKKIYRGAYAKRSTERKKIYHGAMNRTSLLVELREKKKKKIEAPSSEKYVEIKSNILVHLNE